MTLALSTPSSRVIDGKYAILHELGSGAAGTVFAAEHVVIGKRVAVKVLDPVLAQNPALQARFVAEARAAARIGHANVVDIHDLGTAPDGTSYMVMELLDGETLEEVLDLRGAIPAAYACELMLQILAGLGAAHAQGIVHCDLKPANVIVTHPRPDRPLVKVLDFGIAKGVVDADEAHLGALFGTPLYMAPEQALGREVDQRTDLYAASAMLFEMLAGRPAYEGKSTSVILARVITGTRPTLAELNPDLPEELSRIVEAGMECDPSDRFGTAEEFAEQLRQFVSPAHSTWQHTARSGTHAPIPLVLSTKDEQNPFLVGAPPPPTIGLSRLSEAFLITPRIPRLALPPLMDGVLPRGARQPKRAKGLERQAESSARYGRAVKWARACLGYPTSAPLNFVGRVKKNWARLSGRPAAEIRPH